MLEPVESEFDGVLVPSAQELEVLNQLEGWSKTLIESDLLPLLVYPLS